MTRSRKSATILFSSPWSVRRIRIGSLEVGAAVSGGHSRKVSIASWPFAMIRSARGMNPSCRVPSLMPILPAPADTTIAGEAGYRQALLANVLNPKAASIFLTLMPQFMVAGTPLAVQFAVLTTAQALLISVWLAAWAVALRHGRRALAAPRVLRGVRLVGAMLLVVLGLRTALVA